MHKHANTHSPLATPLGTSQQHRRPSSHLTSCITTRTRTRTCKHKHTFITRYTFINRHTFSSPTLLCAFPMHIHTQHTTHTFITGRYKPEKQVPKLSYFALCIPYAHTHTQHTQSYTHTHHSVQARNTSAQALLLRFVHSLCTYTHSHTHTHSPLSTSQQHRCPSSLAPPHASPTSVGECSYIAGITGRAASLK